jgi:predicted GNAT superfamily acetyltransferase
VEILNPSSHGESGWPVPCELSDLPSAFYTTQPPAMSLVEIPPDFQQLRSAQKSLALEWRLHTRLLFEMLFKLGYLVTDFIHLPASRGSSSERSFYVLSYGESTL